MSKSQPRTMLFVITAVALSIGVASAQEPPSPRGGRFLDLLRPGQRVRLDDMGQQDPTGIQLVLVPESEWKEIEEGAAERMQRVMELEEQLEALDKQQSELVALYQRQQPGERTGLDRDALTEIAQAQQKLQQQMASIYSEIDMLSRKLPSSVSRIEIVGEDYVGIDTGNAVVFYPAGRLREITKLKETPEDSAAAAEEPATDEEPTDAKPAAEANTDAEATPAEDADTKDQ